MKNKKNWNLYFLISLLIFVIPGFLTFLLIEIPFGFVFKLCLYSTLVGLFAILTLLCLRLVYAKRSKVRYLGIFAAFISFLLLIAVNIFAVDSRILLNLELSSKPTKVEWQEDLKFLAEQLEETHPGLYSLIPKEEFEMKVNDLNNRILEISDEKLPAEFAKILALINDAHTYPNIFSFNLGWHIFPVQTYCFDDGVYITNAGRGDKDLIESRIVKIENIPIDEVLQRMGKYLGAENKYGSKARNPFLIAEWLYAENIISDVNKAFFTVKNEFNEERIVKLKPVHYIPYFYWSMVKRCWNVLRRASTLSLKR